MYLLEHVLPILGRFSITMAQPRRSTIDLSTPPDLSLNQPRTGAPCPPPSCQLTDTLLIEFTLTITPGHDLQENLSIVLLARDTVKIRAVLEECKRLRELSGEFAATLISERSAQVAHSTCRSATPRMTTAFSQPPTTPTPYLLTLGLCHIPTPESPPSVSSSSRFAATLLSY